MNEYVIGIDIGASKSHLALFDTDGNIVELGRWGPLNYEVLPGLYAQFEDELGQFILQVLSKNGISMKQISCSVLGVGGVDTAKQHRDISGILGKLGFRQFTLVNDAFLGIMAGSKSGTGICAINGSGCTLAGINKNGNMMQIGGVGVVSADMGGGGYMSKRVISAVYCELFRRGEPTYMTQLLFDKLGITSKYDYVEKIYEKTREGTFDIQKCNWMLFEAVKHNDRVAAVILNDTAVNYANGISCMIEEMRFPPEDELYMIFAGSVFVKGEHPMLLDTLKAKIHCDNPDYNFCYRLLDVPNVAGAVVSALKTLHGRDGFYDKVLAQLRDLNL